VSYQFFIAEPDIQQSLVIDRHSEPMCGVLKNTGI